MNKPLAIRKFTFQYEQLAASKSFGSNFSQICRNMKLRREPNQPSKDYNVNNAQRLILLSISIYHWRLAFHHTAHWIGFIIHCFCNSFNLFISTAMQQDDTHTTSHASFIIDFTHKLNIFIHISEMGCYTIVFLSPRIFW